MNLSATIDIDRPTTEAFAYVMEVSHDVQWRTSDVDAGFTADGRPRIGTTGYDKIDANGRQAMATWTVVDFEQDSYARWTLDTGPIKGTGGYICDPIEAGTRFTLEAHVKPAGWYRTLGLFFGMIGRRQNRADVQKLKAILEAGR